MLIDTHAHIFYENFKDDLDEVIQRAKDNGVEKIIVPATDLKTCTEVISLAEKYEIIYGTAGVHPHETKDWDKANINQLEKFAQHEKIIGIGEIGLDYYYDFSPKEKQKEAFTDQLNLAVKLGLPAVIHNRDSDDDMLEVIDSYKGSGLKAQFHCFNASSDHAAKYIEMGHYISFTGNITFKKADSLRNVLMQIPLDRIMVETDSPFITPVPFRGKRNEPAYVKYVAEKTAEIHGITFEEAARISSENACRFFNLKCS